MVSAPMRLGDLGDDRGGTGAGAAALAGGDEHHVGALEHLFDLVAVLLGGLLADLGVGAGAQAAGELAADVELDVGVAHQQRLGVGVDGDELDALQPGVDHAVDGVDAATADADDLDDRQVVLWVAGHSSRYLQGGRIGGCDGWGGWWGCSRFGWCVMAGVGIGFGIGSVEVEEPGHARLASRSLVWPISHDRPPGEVSTCA